jgi:hypothetical protein
MSKERGVKILITEKNLIPSGKKGYMTFSAGQNNDESWRLKVRKGGDMIIDTLVSVENSLNGWMDFRIDISEFAGRENLPLTIFAEQNEDIPAINYWSDFNIELE